MTKHCDIIDRKRIERLLEGNARPSEGEMRDLLSKACALKGLTLDETARLLAADDPQQIEAIFEAARFVKEAVYGKRIVLFAPLYLSNECANDCLYCGFRRSNAEMVRRTLSMDEIGRETEALLSEGHKRLLVVAGEGRATGIDYIEGAIARIYAARRGEERIRRANVNAAPMTVEEFRRLKAAGIGTYQVFQETYHPETYSRMHPSGPKADYAWRIEAPDRAIEAGIDDIGIGALFGLADFRFEVLSIFAHAEYLDRRFGVGPHTISVPRIEPASNAPAAARPPSPVSDADFRKIVACLRLAVPYTGIILSTREPPALRDEVIGLGVSQISSGSRTSPGGYTDKTAESCQFSLSDTRGQRETIAALLANGHLPSFCTACYRSGRTGESFMDLAKPGEIKKLCHPNCLITFEEYLLDHGSTEERQRGEALISQSLLEITDKKTLRRTEEALENLRQGKRDIYL
ncbi:MAG: [FeFe] hydrogenase H-cluster radical SAM maturase HydG [Pseudomonadota bacterium]